MKLQELIESIVNNDAGKSEYSKIHKFVKFLAPHMKRGGMDATPQNIAQVLGTKDVDSVEKAITNGINKKRIDPSMLGQATNNDILHRLVVDVVDAIANKSGMSDERVSQRTGIPIDKIHNALNANTIQQFEQYIQQLKSLDPQRFSFKFNPGKWYGGERKKPTTNIDRDSLKGLKTTEERNEARMAAIYKEAKDATNNFSPQYAGTLNGEMLAAKLGIDRTATVTDTIRNNQHDERMRQVLAFFKRDLQIQRKK